MLLLGAIPQNLVIEGLIDSSAPTTDGTRWLVPLLAGGQIVLLLLATGLSVAKPTARLRRARPSSHAR